MAVASRDRDRADAYAREHEIPIAYGSYNELLGSSHVDVVYNALPNSLHVDWTIRACEAGKHVLCEKPLALSVADVDRVALAARQHRRVVAEAFMYRHHPQTRRVRELVAQGTVGDVHLIRGAFTFTLTNAANIRLDPALGGGSLWDVGCYPVSWARTILGAEPELAFGHAWWSDRGVDHAFAGQLLFPNGVTAQFDCGFSAPFRTEIDVVGSEGMLRIERPYKPPVEGAIEIVRGGDRRLVSTDGQGLYVGQLDDMASAVIDGAMPVVTLEDTRANTAALVALYASARGGTAQPVPLAHDA